MSTFVTSKSYHEVKKNGKLVDKKILDATYDGNKAIIDSYNNHKAYRFEIPKRDIEKILNKMTSYSSDNSEDSISLLEENLLNGKNNVSIKQISSKKPLLLKTESSLNSKSKPKSKPKPRKGKQSTRGRPKRRGGAYTRR